MTDKQIKNLILTGEGYHIEFKRTLDKSLIDEVCAFANSSGGYILMGVDDNKTIKGIDTSNRFRSQIQDTLSRLQPKLNIAVEVKKNLIVIHVPEGQEKPYGCPRGFFMRIGANSQKMTRNEIISFFKKEGRVHFEELVNEKADFKKDFDPKAFKHFLKLSGISSTIQRETLLQNLDCLTSDKKFTNLGVLFFAKDLDFIMNYAYVDCVLFRGQDKVKILDRKQYKGNIIQNIEDALSFVQRHTNTEYVITGQPRREEIPDYPETALRETIVNAVCHRDYFERRCHVVVEVFADRVEIYNPGGLPSGLDPKEFGTKSVPRNLLVADMLHRVNYIERAGTGISRIRQALSKHKKKVLLDIQYDKSSMFYSVVFRKKGLVENTKKGLVENTKKGLVENTKKGLVENTKKGLVENTKKRLVENTKKRLVENTKKGLVENTKKRLVENTKKRLVENQSKILKMLIKKPTASKQKIAKSIGISSTAVDKNIEVLKKKGFLKRIGPAKGGYWKVLKKGL